MLSTNMDCHKNGPYYMTAMFVLYKSEWNIEHKQIIIKYVTKIASDLIELFDDSIVNKNIADTMLNNVLRLIEFTNIGIINAEHILNFLSKYFEKISENPDFLIGNASKNLLIQKILYLILEKIDLSQFNDTKTLIFEIISIENKYKIGNYLTTELTNKINKIHKIYNSRVELYEFLMLQQTKSANKIILGKYNIKCSLLNNKSKFRLAELLENSMYIPQIHIQCENLYEERFTMDFNVYNYLKNVQYSDGVRLFNDKNVSTFAGQFVIYYLDTLHPTNEFFENSLGIEEIASAILYKRQTMSDSDNNDKKLCGMTLYEKLVVNLVSKIGKYIGTK